MTADEMIVVLDSMLADEIATEFDVWNGGTGTTIEAELETCTLEAELDAKSDGVEVVELEYNGIELVTLLNPGTEGVAVGYPPELGLTGAERLNDTEDAGTELGGCGTTAV